jgi:hypothetical protein
MKKQQSCLISLTLKSWSGRKRLDHTTYVSLAYSQAGDDDQMTFR